MDTPREARNPVMVRVTVHEAGKPNSPAIHDRTGDHNDRFFRDWVGSTTWWAMRNGKVVISTPE